MLFVRLKPSVLFKVRNPVVRLNKLSYSLEAATTSRKVECEIPTVKNEKSEPQYPPILDTSLKAQFMRNREDQARKVANARTVEEKMIKLNMPRYYGFRSVILDEFNPVYGGLEQSQYLTRTYFHDQPGLPTFYDDLVSPEFLQEIMPDIEESVKESLIFEYSSRNRLAELEASVLEEENLVTDIISKAVTKQVHKAVMSKLAAENSYLVETEMDLDPRIEAFWFAGGIYAPTSAKYWRQRAINQREKAVTKMPKEFLDYPVDRGMQYLGYPILQLRHKNPLKEILPLSASEDSKLEIPVFKYEPKTMGYGKARRHGTNIPGFWPGDTSEFGFISYHKSGYLAVRQFNDTQEAIKIQSILASFGWLFAQACNLGFSTFNEITYPLVNQMVITNGKWWTFSVYQLNTMMMHSFFNDENPRRNFCWVSEPMELFERIEDNEVHGFNPKVLETLVKFYLNKPVKREGVEMKPYLQVGEGIVANIPSDIRRTWLEERFKLLQSNRPRHRLEPEIYPWQHIYMRLTNSRPMEKKRYPFQIGINPYQRRLDDHCPKYRPRAIRGKNGRPKFERAWYP